MGGDVDQAVATCEELFGPYSSHGCGESRSAGNEPIHTVYLDAYYMDKYEVTNAQYNECVEAEVCEPPKQSYSHTRESYYGNPKYDKYPVICINWYDAKTYCRWRGGRLPSEEEWEKAARDPHGRIFPWGNSFENKLNFCDKKCDMEWANNDLDDGYADTAPVGSFPEGVSLYGIHDMAGNIWEWTASWYKAYPGAEDTTDIDFGEVFKSVRGGSWRYGGSVARTNHRAKGDPLGQNNNDGFRCVKDISKE